MTNHAIEIKKQMGVATTNNEIAVRSITEVQAQLFAAKQFPRDEDLAHRKIIKACERVKFADKCIFSYPRGGQTIQGGTIRLAESMASYWGNIQHGTIEVESSKDETKFKSYAWDLETNVRVEKEFTVQHRMKTRKGFKDLDDPRDIYEHVANFGARRRRACIFELLPTDFIEDAIEACRKTQLNDKRPIHEIIASLQKAFGEFNVTTEMIVAKYGVEIEKLSKENIQELRSIYGSIKDGQAYVKDFFTKEDAKKDKLNNIGKKPEVKYPEVIEPEVKGEPKLNPIDSVENDSKKVKEIMDKMEDENTMDLPFEEAEPKKEKVNTSKLYSESINRIMLCKSSEQLNKLHDELTNDLIHLDESQVKDILKTFKIQSKQFETKTKKKAKTDF